MKCPVCMAEIDNDSVFCFECGASLYSTIADDADATNVVDESNDNLPDQSKASEPFDGYYCGDTSMEQMTDCKTASQEYQDSASDSGNSISNTNHDCPVNPNAVSQQTPVQSKSKKKTLAILFAALGVSVVTLLIIIIALLSSKAGKHELSVSLSPEEQIINNYTSICNKLSSEEKRMAELISHAEDKLNNTDENDVADTYVLESLSNILLEATGYSIYSPISHEAESEDILSEVTVVEETYSNLIKLNKSLESAIKEVDNSINELERIKKEKMAALVWPGKTYTWESKDSNGYVVDVKMKFGSWIRASDTENLNLAWERAGGEGDAPDISTFSVNNYKFRGDNAVMTFATLEYTNKTTGYDFSEQYPYKCNATLCTRLQLPSSWNYAWQGYIYFSNGASAMNNGTMYSTVSMTRNHWGPVTIAFAVSNIFGPNFDEMGDPALDEVYFSFGGDAIKIPAIWKTTEPITLSESDYKVPYGYSSWDWDFRRGKMTTEGWADVDSVENKADLESSLVLQYYRFELGKGYYYHRGGNSEMSVNLSRLYTNFQGDITVAAESKENRGNLTVKVYGDGKLLWESGIITGTSSDIHFDIDVTDVQKLQIVSVTDESNPGPSVAIINDIIS